MFFGVFVECTLALDRTNLPQGSGEKTSLYIHRNRISTALKMARDLITKLLGNMCPRTNVDENTRTANGALAQPFVWRVVGSRRDSAYNFPFRDLAGYNSVAIISVIAQVDRRGCNLL